MDLKNNRLTQGLEREQLKASFNVKGDNIIIAIAYGDEHPVYLRARALWEFYSLYYPNVEIIFVRESKKLKNGEIQHNGYDLLIGVEDKYESNRSMQQGFVETGIWSVDENKRMTHRTMIFCDYLLRRYNNPFYLYANTITSVVDFRGVLSLLHHLPKAGCVAGFPIFLPTGFNFVSGSSFLFSRDVIQLMRDRYIRDHEHTQHNADVWLGIVLADVPRTPLPIFNFTKPRGPRCGLDEVRSLVRTLLREGHFHFRVKTTSDEEGLGAREDVDPWIMLAIMEEILANLPSPEANLKLLHKVGRAFNAVDGVIPSIMEEMPFNTPRDFPINDSEAQIIYPHLFSA